MVKVVHTDDIFASKDSHSYKSVFQTKERYEVFENYGKSTYDSMKKVWIQGNQIAVRHIMIGQRLMWGDMCQPKAGYIQRFIMTFMLL